jgi:hypothetical protein
MRRRLVLQSYRPHRADPRERTMLPVKVCLVPLGNLKYPVSISELEGWKSQLISIRHGAAVGHLPDSEGDQWEYPDHQLLQVLSAETDSDFTLGVINAQLQDNFYLRRLSERTAVLSLYEMADIVRYSDFDLEQYILRNIYELAVLFAANGKLLPTSYATWAHEETRGCLFDMNANKSDIVFSLHRPVLCAACTTRVSAKQLPPILLLSLGKELRRIQKGLYVRIGEWVKLHPIFALLITAAAGIGLNLIASVIFETGKRFLPWLA